MNLEYDQVFTEMVIAAQFGEEQQSGSQIIPEQEPDPAAVIEKAEAVLAQSHDLRAAVLLGYGELRRNGFPGFARATGYIRACLEEFWDTCHPQLDAEDDDDPTMRVNAILDLANSRMTLHAARRAPLTDSRNFGRMSLRDIEIANGEIEAPADMESLPDSSRISAAFQDTPKEALGEIHAGARSAFEDVQRISAIFDERIPGRGPTLTPLLQVLKRVVDRLNAEAGEPEADEPTGEEEAATDVSGPSVEAGAARSDKITTRQDVERAIDRILAYYGRYEPSSPVPILLTRAKKLVGADFMTIVNEIAPGGADNVKLIGGLE